MSLSTLAPRALLTLACLGLLTACQATTDDASLNSQDVRIDEQANQELAAQILTEVQMVYAMPDGEQPTVAVVRNVESLREMNRFYDAAQNGDYLIVTRNRAILYDADDKRILDMVPVKQQGEAGGAVSSAPVGE